MNFTNTDCVELEVYSQVKWQMYNSVYEQVNKQVEMQMRRQVKRQICTIPILNKIEQEIKK